MSEEKQAVSDYELIAELVDPNTPKNEREHAAVRQMTSLWEQLAEQVSELARLKEKKMSDAPERIYLTEWLAPALSIRDFGNDIEYVRGDIHEAELARLREERDRYRAALERL